MLLSLSVKAGQWRGMNPFRVHPDGTAWFILLTPTKFLLHIEFLLRKNKAEAVS